MPPPTKEDAKPREYRVAGWRVTAQEVASAATAGAIVLAAAWCAKRVHVCGPNHVLVKTGPFVRGQFHISRRTIRLPFQSVAAYSLRPQTHNIRHSMRVKGRVETNIELSLATAPYDPFRPAASIRASRAARTIHPLPPGVELPHVTGPSVQQGATGAAPVADAPSDHPSGDSLTAVSPATADEAPTWLDKIWPRRDYGLFGAYVTRVGLSVDDEGPAKIEEVRKLIANAVDGGARSLVAGLTHETLFANPDQYAHHRPRDLQ